MRRFGVLFCFFTCEDAGGARAWVVAWTPASAKSASARTPTSLRGVVVRRSRVSEARDAGRRVSSSRRVRRVGFAGRAFGGGEDACVLESLDLRASRGVNPGTQRRRARVIDASSRRFSKTARTLRGPRLRSRRAASRACSRLPCLCHRNHPWRSRTRGLPRASSSPRGTRARVSADFPLHVQLNLGTKLFFAASWRPLRSVTAATSDARSSPLPFAPRSARNAARREHEPRDDRPKPGRRGDPRAPARRRAPPVRRGGAPGGWHGLQSLRRVGSPRHAVRGLRVRGGQDRQRAGRHPRRFAGRARARRGAPARLRAPARTHAFSVSRHTPSADTRILRLAFSSSRGLARAFCAFEKPRSCSARLSRSARLALQPRASDAFGPSFSVRLLCDRSPPRRRRRRNASPAR